MNLIKPLVPQPVATPAGIKALCMWPYLSYIYNDSARPQSKFIANFWLALVGHTQTIKYLYFDHSPALYLLGKCKIGKCRTLWGKPSTVWNGQYPQ